VIARLAKPKAAGINSAGETQLARAKILQFLLGTADDAFVIASLRKADCLYRVDGALIAGIFPDTNVVSESGKHRNEFFA
jgi:hypothetical protein